MESYIILQAKLLFFITEVGHKTELESNTILITADEAFWWDTYLFSILECCKYYIFLNA